MLRKSDEARKRLSRTTDWRKYRCDAYLQAMACGNSYNYDVSGYCGAKAVTGNVDACSRSKDVEGELTFDDGRHTSFSGEWIGNGEIEGSADSGESCDLEVE